MYRAMSLLFGITALGAIATVADARDGCGRGLYWNGYRCAPEYYGPPPGSYYGPPPGSYYGPPPDRGPSFLFEFGGRNEPQYRPPARAPRGQPVCPRNYTVQDGVCKPYTGR
jgi:hypothetical protein